DWCDPKSLGFETTAELPDLEGNVGQDRAMSAIDFGLGMKTKGYNIFAAGPTGTGRNFAVLSRAKATAEVRPVPDDWCYVYNFEDARRPRALRLPAGTAPTFSSDIEELVRLCRQDIPRAFESEAYEDRKEKATGDIQAERNRVLQELDEEARSQGFMIQATPMGLITVPTTDGKPMSREDYEALPGDERTAIEEKMDRLRARVQETVSQVRSLEKQARRRLEELDREVAMAAIGERIAEVREKYQDYPAITAHLQAIADDLVTHHAEFRGTEQVGSDGLALEGVPTRYRVNVLVSQKRGEGAPVISENSPSYYNLVGRLEYRPVAGGATTDHMLIKPGAVHRANGGYLILQALDVLTAPFAWDALKRSLRSEEATIENIGEQWSPVPAATLCPDPIPLDVRIILVGSPLLYFLLYQYDEDFGKLFKVKADFDNEMRADEGACRSYASFIATHCHRHELRPVDCLAVARIIDYGKRVAEDRERLSTRLGQVADLLAEADYWAGKEGAEVITTRYIEQALAQKEYRAERLEDRVHELIARGDLVVDVDGQRVGQVNGLALLDLGDHVFGRPSRITARVTPGRAGVVDIEREARLGGQIHQKAVMILSGYLIGTYGSETPLSLSASIAFEQSYGPVEGDSASCAELCAILSGLAEVPLRQDIAITGSVDQHGRVQVIGGVNHKIEGFYTACKAKGMTGMQGCIIPRQNIKNLMLKPEVVEAVREGRFHIWAVSTVEEAIAILTGVPAGPPDKPDTIHGKATARLKKFAQALRGTREGRPAAVIELPPGVGGPRPPAPPTPPPEPPTPPPPPIPPSGQRASERPG
ncbi:MAG: AAA family ATPase, partial [Armatimonadetes bacterium]|nr:AAA family ATPase [Armatimonadota bacterium]